MHSSVKSLIGSDRKTRRTIKLLIYRMLHLFLCSLMTRDGDGRDAAEAGRTHG